MTKHFLLPGTIERLIQGRYALLSLLIAIILLIIKITISSIVISFKKLLFSTNSLVKLLSDSLISQSYSKL